MNKIMISIFLCLVIGIAKAQESEIIKSKGYTLNFLNNDASFDPALKKRSSRFIQYWLKILIKTQLKK
jgi:hypothetical protein